LILFTFAGRGCRRVRQCASNRNAEGRYRCPSSRRKIVFRHVVAATVVLFAPSIVSAAESPAPAAQEFVDRVGSWNTFEIRASEIALSAAESAAVEAFARQMIDDHTKAAVQLDAAARAADPSLEAPDSVERFHEEMLKTLRNASGEEFDLRYVDMLNQAHDTAAALFADYSKQGADPTLRAFARARLPTTLKHRWMFRTIDRALEPPHAMLAH
jgi:putative membrane protein